MLRSAAVFLVSVGILAGCDGVPDLVSRSKISSEPPAFVASSPNPQDMVASPSSFGTKVPLFLQDALSHSPEVAAAEAVLEDYEYREEAVKWQIAPTPYIGATATGSDGAGARIGVRQPVWSGGRWHAEKRLSAAEVQKAKAHLDDVRGRIAFDICDAFAEWARAQYEVSALELSLRTHRELGQQIDRRFELGAASASEKVLLANRRDRTLLDLGVAGNKVTLAEEQLRLLAGGLENGTLTALLEDPVTLNAVNAPAMPAAAVAIAQAEYEIARASTRMAKAGARPSIHLDMGQNLSAGAGSYVQLGFDTAFLAGLGGRKRLSGHAAAEKAAARRVELAASTADAVFTEALHNARSAEAQLLLREQMVGAQDKLFASYRRQFKLGDRSWLDVLNAAQEANAARVALAGARAERIRANWIVAIHQGLVHQDLPARAKSESSI